MAHKSTFGLRKNQTMAPRKTYKPLAWHEECLANNRASLFHDQNIAFQLRQNIERIQNRIAKIETALAKARAKGLTEMPIV